MILKPGEVAEHEVFGWRGTVTRVVPPPYSTTHVKLADGRETYWYTENVTRAAGAVEGGAPLPKADP